MRMPAGKPAKAGRSLTRSSKNLLGRLVIAEVRALPNETSAEIGGAPSMRSKPSRMPASSTMVTETLHLFFSASAMQAAIMVFTSAEVRHGLLRMASPCGESRSAARPAGGRVPIGRPGGRSWRPRQLAMFSPYRLLIIDLIGGSMNLIHLYIRVLKLLGPERKLGWILAAGNLALAGAQFAEPILFGKVIDTLAGAQARGGTLVWSDLFTLLGAWVGFGLFTIVCGTLVALHADRLSHRRRLAVLTDYFAPVLQLPQAYHGTTHSGRLLKVMLTGADVLWGLWLAFFRDHFVGFVSLLVLLPLSLFLNWRLASLLIGLCFVFAILM